MRLDLQAQGMGEVLREGFALVIDPAQQVAVTDKGRARRAQDLQAQGVRVLRWQELIEAGRADPRPGVSAAGTDLCTIMYTSGTTGKPKARSLKP